MGHDDPCGAPGQRKTGERAALPPVGLPMQRSAFEVTKEEFARKPAQVVPVAAAATNASTWNVPT